MMRDYRDTPVCDMVDRTEPTMSIKGALQEANKILMETISMLNDIEANVIGGRTDDERLPDRNCLIDEAMSVSKLSYSVLQRMSRIRDALI